MLQKKSLFFFNKVIQQHIYMFIPATHCQCAARIITIIDNSFPPAIPPLYTPVYISDAYTPVICHVFLMKVIAK